MTRPVGSHLPVPPAGKNSFASSSSSSPLACFPDTLITSRGSSCIQKCYQFIVSKFSAFLHFILSFFRSSPTPSTAPPVPSNFSSITNNSFLTQINTSPLSQQIAQLKEQAQKGFVAFYNQQENSTTAFLGNFHPRTLRVTIEGVGNFCFQNSEAAFQAHKFQYQPDAYNIIKRFENYDGDTAWREADKLKNYIDPAWRHGRRNLEVMKKVVYFKFFQNSDLKDLLLATGNARLVEHIPAGKRKPDKFWGDGHDGTGQNQLGRILEDVRQELGGSPPLSTMPQAYLDFIRG